jgi:hypothetical protein
MSMPLTDFKSLWIDIVPAQPFSAEGLFGNVNEFRESKTNPLGSLQISLTENPNLTIKSVSKSGIIYPQPVLNNHRHERSKQAVFEGMAP